MASRTKQKEEARARRLAEERVRVERQRRQRRMQTTIGIVLAAVAVLAVAIVISSSGSSSATGLQKGTQLTKTQTGVSQLLSGIPQSGSVLGNPKAPVTMVYFGDLECPICKAFTLQGGFPQLVAKDVRAGKVKIQYRSFETATQDPTTFQIQQVAALAAGKQNHFWDYTDLFYNEQGQEGSGYVTEPYLDSLASQVPGLNINAWRTARNDATLANQVHSDDQSGKTAGVTGTPTLVFEGPHGKTTALEGVPSYSTLEKSILSVA